MSVSFLLQDIADALEMAPESGENYLDLEAGTVVYVTAEDQDYLEEEDDEGLPDWQREHLKTVRRVLASEQVFMLPTKYEVNSWSIMESFCFSLVDGNFKERLLATIHGKGAFGRFKAQVEEHGLLQEWYAYKRSAYERISREWLESQNISWKE